MARVLFLDPRGWQGASEGQRPYPNVGIAYLAAALKRHGHELRVLDLNNEPWSDDEAVALALDYRPDVLAFSVKTATMRSARALGVRLREALPRAVVTLGGPHATLCWRDLVREAWLDFIFLGEGEQAFPEMCSRLLSGGSLADFGQVAGRGDGGRDLSAACALEPDLDALEFPDFSDFPLAVRSSLAMAYPLVTSRGCVFACTYCSVPNVSGKRFRRRSSESIVGELRRARSHYAVRRFELIDDAFNIDARHAKNVCRALISSGLGLTWSCPNGIRVDLVDAELAALMRTSGCDTVMIGVESAVPEILASVKKGETLEDIRRGIRTLQTAGIEVGGYFIIGLPGDSFAGAERSVRFARDMGIAAHFNMLVPYPGTAIWDWVQRHGRFLVDIEDGMHHAGADVRPRPVFDTPDFPAAERVRAYEMVHTRMGRFESLIPAGTGTWQWRRRKLALIWRHDRVRLPRRLFAWACDRCRRAVRLGPRGGAPPAPSRPAEPCP